MNKFKSIFTIVLAFLFVFGFTVSSFILPDKAISNEENRNLQQFPDVKLQTILDGKFMTDFDKYTLDQFPLRNSFRSIKAQIVFNLLRQKDNNGYFMQGDYIFKNSHVYNTENVDHAIDRINFYYERLLTENNKAYLCIIPDKNYYNSEKIALKLNYDRLFNTIRENTGFAEYIDVTDKLTLDSYYATDTHWRQEKIINVADFILESMDAPKLAPDYTVESTGRYFKGVFARQTTFETEGDLMNYVTSPLLYDQSILTDYENSQVPIYNFDKIDSREPYDMFMSYARVGMMVLERKVKSTGRELIVFRDSFGSSIGPLLLAGYDKITFIDTRETRPVAIKNNVEFTNQDVLFLYSSTVINDTKEMQ